MFEYRVTKFDPALRDVEGRDLGEDWTSYSDIGRAFRGERLTRPVYLAVEDAYVSAAVAFLREAEVTSVIVRGLEAHVGRRCEIAEGQTIELRRLRTAIRRVLREDCWCRFERTGCYLHFGYDYYMYVGVPRPCSNAHAVARDLGLFVEPFSSPYRQPDAD